MENSTVTKPAFAALLCIGLSAAAAPALAQEQAAPAQEPAASTAAPAPTPAQPSTEAPAGKMTQEQIAAFNQAVADFTAGQQLQQARSEEHTSELQSLMRISYAVFCLKKKNNKSTRINTSKQILLTYIHKH